MRRPNQALTEILRQIESIKLHAPHRAPGLDDLWELVNGIQTICSAHGAAEDEETKSEEKVCPECGAWQIEGHGVDIINKAAEQEVSCLMCDAEWIDAYTLAGYRLTAGPDLKALSRLLEGGRG